MTSAPLLKALLKALPKALPWSLLALAVLWLVGYTRELRLPSGGSEPAAVVSTRTFCRAAS